MVIGYDYEVWKRLRIKASIDIDLRTHPHMIITGASGSGKSYALKFLLDKLLSTNDVKITFCNFKKSEDFKFLNTYPEYYTYLDCGQGLEIFYNELKALQHKEIDFDDNYHILVFDEFPAFIMSTGLQDKKMAEAYKMMVSEVLMLGRSYGFGIWMIMQRPDSSFLSNGARDNFHITISLGNFSKEHKQMLYSGYDLPSDRIYDVGTGICWTDGMGLREIKFPKIQDMKALEQRILKRLSLRP